LTQPKRLAYHWVMNEAARQLGRLGGLSRSEAKVKAARLNGTKRKSQTRPVIDPKPTQSPFGKGWSSDAYL